jgi:GTP cyclohydrolase II
MNINPTKTQCKIRQSISIPIRGYSSVFHSFYGLEDNREHIAIELGEIGPYPLVRIHSECLTGDVFGSQKCDCGEQLHESLEKISRQGGYLLYLRQEGRDIGLYNKLDAYALQSKGHDTFSANTQLGLQEDQRSYIPAAQMLQALGATTISLLTNNPDKKNQLELRGITIHKCVETSVYLTSHNESYLRSKRTKGHNLLLP